MVKNLSEVKNGLVRIAVAYTGTFKQGEKRFAITLSDLEEMAHNLSQREVPLDYQHYSGAAAAGHPVPPDWLHAAGWIERTDKIEDFTGGQKMLWAWAEFTPRCLAAIRAKELRYFSPELSWTGTNEHGESVGTKLNAGAILIRPFLLDLPPIEISASDYPKLLETVSLSESKRVSFRQREGKMQNVEQGKTVSATEELNRGVTLLMSETGLPYDRALSRYARKNPEVYERSKTEVLQGSEFVGAEKVSLGRTGTVSAQEELHRGVTALMSEKQLPYDKALSEFSRKHPAVWYRHLAESTQG